MKRILAVSLIRSSPHDRPEFPLTRGGLLSPARQRSRPGTAPEETIYVKVLDPCVLESPHIRPSRARPQTHNGALRSGRLVSDKPANKAFLTSPSRRAQHLKLVEADRIRRLQRTPVYPPSSSSPSSSPSSYASVISTIRSILILCIFLPLFSHFLTSTYTFHTSPYLKRYWDRSAFNSWKREIISFTPIQLSMYDGSDLDLPVYLGIDGLVYDVSKNRRVYGKGGSYNMM